MFIMKRKIAGIMLVMLSLSTLGFWELWGRENLTYDRVLVLKESLPQNTLVTEDMFRERRIEKRGTELFSAAREMNLKDLKLLSLFRQELNFTESIFRNPYLQ